MFYNYYSMKNRQKKIIFFIIFFQTTLTNIMSLAMKEQVKSKTIKNLQQIFARLSLTSFFRNGSKVVKAFDKNHKSCLKIHNIELQC